MKSGRLEAGLRLWKPWLFAGFVTRDTAVLLPPTVIDSAYSVAYVGRRKGIYGGHSRNALQGPQRRRGGHALGLRGILPAPVPGAIRDLSGHPLAVAIPQRKLRAEAGGDPRLPWRGKVPDARRRSSYDGLEQASPRPSSRYASFAAWPATRFATRSASNTTIFPDLIMPRAVGVYGLRWEFWN